MQKQNNKGQGLNLASLGGLAVLIAVGFLTAAIGTRVIERTGDIFTNLTVAENLTEQGEQALQAWADFGSIIGLVVVAGVVLGIVRQFL